MTFNSMTGFAEQSDRLERVSWRWELKSVNGRGFDVRFRLPPGFDAIERSLRDAAGLVLKRGNVTVGLQIARTSEEGALTLNRAALASVLDAAAVAYAGLAERGIEGAASVDGLLNLRGVLEPAHQDDDEVAVAALRAAVTESFAVALAALAQSRAQEGARLAATLGEQIDQVEVLTVRAAAAAEARSDTASGRLRARIAELLGAGAEVDEARLAQELALLAVKGDVREEIDRLTTHVAAARDLLAAPPPVGRKLDFLTQEFNREANTLCSKASSAELTTIGMAMKVIIDQIREQAQNVE